MGIDIRSGQFDGDDSYQIHQRGSHESLHSHSELNQKQSSLGRSRTDGFIITCKEDMWRSVSLIICVWIVRSGNPLIMDNGVIYPSIVMMHWKPPNLMHLSYTLFLYHSSCGDLQDKHILYPQGVMSCGY